MGRISSLARPPAGMQCRAGAAQQCPPSPVSAFENTNVKHSIISAQYGAEAGKWFGAALQEVAGLAEAEGTQTLCHSCCMGMLLAVSEPGMQGETHAEVWDADEGARAGLCEAVALHYGRAHGHLQKLLHMPCSTHEAFRCYQLYS